MLVDGKIPLPHHHQSKSFHDPDLFVKLRCWFLSRLFAPCFSLGRPLRFSWVSGSSGGFENRADDVMGTDGERTLTLEQFLRDTSAQRAVDANLFLRSFLNAVSTSTLGPCVPENVGDLRGTEVAVGLGMEFDEPISMGSDLNPTETCATSSAFFSRWQVQTQRDESAELHNGWQHRFENSLSNSSCRVLRDEPRPTPRSSPFLPTVSQSSVLRVRAKVIGAGPPPVELSEQEALTELLRCQDLYALQPQTSRRLRPQQVAGH